MTTTEQAAQTLKSKRLVSAKERRAEIVIAALFLVTAAASIPMVCERRIESIRAARLGRN